MEKPSRRRRPLLRPLPLPHPCLTRFILSHPRAVRLRMEKRGRQIRCSAPMRNLSKLKRGRSSVTPRRTRQTLTSSSKVEAALMSDKYEIRFDADPIQGASGGPGQVVQVSNFVATHGGSSARPPLDLVNFPDEFKSLERDRLLPCDLENTSPAGLRQYDDYLHWFYDSHRGPTPDASLADTASMCLDKEKSMKSLWVSVNARCSYRGGNVGRFIVGCMDTAIEEKGEIEHPFGVDAAKMMDGLKCIAKEAELISEWLRRGRCIFTTDDEYILCRDIRVAAAHLFIYGRKWSVPISAALLGFRKEAELLIENSKCNSDESISTSMKIRQFAWYLLEKKISEIEPFNWESSESEMVSENDDESDNDVSESEDNNNMGDCCDEDYLKYNL